MDIQEIREEIERLKVEINTSPRASPIHTAMKEVTLVAGIKDWTGDSKGALSMRFSLK